LKDVKELYRRFQAEVYGFALVELQFESILSFKPDISTHVALEDLFEILDNDNDGRLDGLELLGGLLLCCNATFEEKARFCFEMFDFNLNASLSQKELVMMILSCLCGMNLLTGGHEDMEPDVETVENIVADAFQKVDINLDGFLSYEEFVVWARSNRDLMNGLDKLNKLAQDAKNDLGSDDSAEEVDENYLSDDYFKKNIRHPLGDMSSPPSANDNKPIVPPWKSQIVEPTNFRVSKQQLDGPRTNLALSWVFGYNCHHGGNNLRYVGSRLKNLVYPTATFAVIFDTESKSQSYYQGHVHEITALAVHPSGNIIATADVDSNIHIWNYTTKTCLTIIKGISAGGIKLLAFSPSGNHIASVGRDQDHTVAIYDTSSSEMLSSAKGISHPNDVYDMSYSNNGTEIALAGGSGHLLILTGANSAKRSIDNYYAKIGSIGKKQSFFSVVYIREDPVVGCGSGEIYRFKSGHCVEVIQAHGVNEPIYSLYFCKDDDTLTSGGRDTVVRTWDSSLKAIGVPIDISEVAKHVASSTATIASGYSVVSVQNIGSKVLVGTKEGDIYDLTISGAAGKNSSIKVSSSHSTGELWGLSVHPSREEFATSGDDKIIRIWSIRSHEVIRQRVMPHGSRAISYNHTGDVIAVGSADGSLALMEANSAILKVYSTWTHSEVAVSCVKFSANASYLAVGTSNGNIYLYRSDDQRNYSKHAVCRGHASAIRSIDFSKDSKYVQSNGDDSNLFYWDMRGSQINTAATVRDLNWSSLTCPLNWACQGFWNTSKSFSSGSVLSCACLQDLNDAAAGYDNGDIRLFYYPAISSDSLHQKYVGHTGAVASVRFSHNRRYLISIGAHDRSIVLWKHDVELDEESGDENAGTSSGSGSDSESTLLNDLLVAGSSTLSDEKTKPGATTGSEALQWRSSVIEPSTAQPTTSQSTDVDLTLAWIHGYRCYDSRNNVFYSSSGTVVYHSGCVAVSYNKFTGKQKFLHGYHHQEILSLGSDTSGQIFASGERGINPRILIWEVSSMRLLNQISTKHEGGIAHLAFNSQGQQLASIGQDKNSTLILYDWSKESEILSSPTTRQRVHCMIFMRFDRDLLSSTVNGSKPLDSEMLPGADVIVTAGQKHLRFQWAQGHNILSQNAMWGDEKRDVIMAIASASSNVCLTGSIKGSLLLWKNFKIERNLRASMSTSTGETYPHQSPVLAIAAVPGRILSSMIDAKKNVFEESILTNYHEICKYIVGDQQGKLSIWVAVENIIDRKLDLILVKVYDMSSVAPKSLNSSIRSIAYREGVVLVGTKGDEIYELSETSIPFLYQPSSKVNIVSQRLVVGHHTAEVWGLCCHPSLPIFFTAGDDGTLRCWSLTDRSLLSYTILPEKARAIDILPTDSSSIAIGYNNGEIWLVNLSKFLNPFNVPGTILDNNLSGQEILLDESAYTTSSASETSKLRLLAPMTTTTAVSAAERGGNLILPKGPSQWIQELKYSFDGQYLVAGCHDGKLYIYHVTKEYGLSAVCSGHTGPVNHFDIGVALAPLKIHSSTNEVNYDAKDKDLEVSRSTTVIMLLETFDERMQKISMIERTQRQITPSRTLEAATITMEERVVSSRAVSPADIIIQSTSELGELFYWRIDGSRISSPVAVKDAWWHTWTIPYGWPVQGIWPLPSEQISKPTVNAVCRSHSWKEVPVIAVADESGHVKLYNYPCLHAGAPEKSYIGHTSQITNMRFSYNDQYCISIGGIDKSIFIWETDILDEIREHKAVSSLTSPSLSLMTAASNRSQTAAESIEEVFEESTFASLLPGKLKVSGGDEFTAVKPWKASIREPTGWIDNDESSKAPLESLELKYVYGYRGWDCRNNLAYSENNQLIYHLAGVGIALNTQSNTQIHNTEHDDDIISMTIHPDAHTLATGEIGKTPKILLWDTNTGATIRAIRYHSRGISHLAFSSDGSMILSTGLDDDRSIAIHATKSGSLIGKGKVGRGVDIFCIAVSMDGMFITAGKNHVKFWQFPSSSSSAGELSSKTGIYGNKAITSRTATAAVYFAGDAITGMVDGSIVLWKERSASKFKTAHTSAVTAMNVIAAEGKEISPRLISGGKDGFVYIWSVHLEKIWSLDMNTTTPLSTNPSIQALSCRRNMLAIGTKASEIYEINLLAEAQVNRLVAGHHVDRAELWGLATHPTIQRFVTCGDDMSVRVWNNKTRILLHTTQLETKARSVAYSPDGSLIVVATMDGHVKFLSNDLSTLLSDMILAATWIQAIQFSPNGNLLAVGAHDGTISIVDIASYSIRNKCLGHHAAITSIDWSNDGTMLQSCSADYELLYWESAQGNQIRNLMSVRDVKWHTNTCLLSWGVQGIWPSGADGTDVNSVDRSPDGKLLVSGDDFKRVKLFRYPCPKDLADYKAYRGHSEHVCRVKFSHDGRHVFSVGGLDKAILQFEVKSSKSKTM
jgi:WD40 repeat protein/Ca2+-binding EF-hand superfamily protein